MRSHPLRLLAAMAIALCAPGALAQTGATVTVTVEGVRSAGGRVTGSLCADPMTPLCSTYVTRAPAVAGRTVLRFTGIAPGRYALSTVHDEDGDGRTEIPPEGFGLGNNAPAPDFQASSLQITDDTATTVAMTYPGSTARRLGSRGVEPSADIVRIDVRENRLYGELYAPKAPAGRRPAIILIDGSVPGLDGVSVVAAALAREGFAALALAYFGEEVLPPNLESVPLEYFDAAVAALKARPDIDPARIGVLGFSRGAEAAFLLASRDPTIRAVAALGPSGAVWPGYNPADPGAFKSAWTVAGRPLPFLDPDVALYNPGGPSTPMFASALSKSDARPEAFIPVERIRGPILMIAGQNDEVWPSPDMAGRIATRLSKAGFTHPVESVVLPDTSHYVLTNAATMPRVVAFFRRSLGN